jgi:hypothetical protein
MWCLTPFSKNGEYNWIGSQEEYSASGASAGGDTGMKNIVHPWTETNYWIRFGRTNAEGKIENPIGKWTHDIIGW